MKIAIKPKKTEVIYDDIKPGTVFQYGGGAIALKLNDDNSILLKYSSGNDWFALDDQSMEDQGIKILGKLDEIRVIGD